MRTLTLFSFSLLAGLSTVQAQTATPACAVSAVPTLVRSEGVTERLGDIVLNCSGTPGQAVTGNLTIILNTIVTNRLSGTNSLNVFLTANSGAGPALVSTPAQPLGNNQVTFNGLQFAIGASGATELRISNLRADATATGVAFENITAQLAFNASALISTTTSRVVAGVPRRGLLASSVTGLVCSQDGSPLPDPVGFVELLNAGTRFSSIRATEGFAGAFEARTAQTDTGVRVVVRYSNVPADARLFVPDFIAGSNATVPTAAGDYGGPISGGQYLSGSGTLALGRVRGHDPNGAGGGVVFAAPASGAFNGVSEVLIANGSGIAVFEVIDSNSAVIESAQIPTFLAVPRSVNERNVTINREVFFGPVSTVPTISPSAPIPRFVVVVPESDCQVRGDCAQLTPRLAIPAADILDLTVIAGLAAYRERYIYIENYGGGVLQWSARLEYKSGASTSWLRISPTSGTNSGQVRVDFMLPGLAVGDYLADIIVDAGPAGLQRLPVRLHVNAAPAPPPVKPTVSSVTNGASFAAGPVAGGSLVTIKGTNLGGSGVSVMFDTFPARVLYSSADQINVQVPAELGSRQSARLVVTVNGVQGDGTTVNLAPVAPGIFVPGILNQNNTVNAVDNPAATGTMVQIFATGLLAADGTGTVEAKLHDQFYTNLPFVGPAPGLPGVQQVNLMIPEGWPTMTTEVVLCSTAGGQRVCSTPARISIRQQQ